MLGVYIGLIKLFNEGLIWLTKDAGGSVTLVMIHLHSNYLAVSRILEVCLISH